MPGKGKGWCKQPWFFVGTCRDMSGVPGPCWLKERGPSIGKLGRHAMAGLAVVLVECAADAQTARYSLFPHERDSPVIFCDVNRLSNLDKS